MPPIKRNKYTVAFPQGKASALVEDGEYTAKVSKIEIKKSANGNDCHYAYYEIMDKGPSKGKTLMSVSAWGNDLGRQNLQDFFFAVGHEAVGDFTFDESTGLSKVVTVIVGSREYEGKMRNVIVAVSALGDSDDDDDDDDAPKAKKPAKVQDDDEDDEEPTPPKKKKVIVEDDEDDEVPVKKPVKKKPADDDDEEEEVKPVKKKKVIDEDDDDDEDEPPRRTMKRR